MKEMIRTYMKVKFGVDLKPRLISITNINTIYVSDNKSMNYVVEYTYNNIPYIANFSIVGDINPA